MYGPVQKQTTITNAGTIVLAHRPVCFQVNNPAAGPNNHSPQLLYESETGDHVSTSGHFFNFTNDDPMEDLDRLRIANGPKLLIKWVEFEFNIQGFVDDTNVRIDFIRQKRMVDPDVWKQSDPNTMFMPHLLNKFKNLAGFTCNEIDRSTFQVLLTRRIYMNSKGSSNLLDGTQDRNTTDATTPPRKRVKVRLNLNRVYRQLKTTIDEATGVDHTLSFDNDPDDHAESNGGYAYDNQHPLANIWCVLSSDDQTAVTSLVDGDAIKIDIIRKICWRDPVAGDH